MTTPSIPVIKDDLDPERNDVDEIYHREATQPVDDVQRVGHFLIYENTMQGNETTSEYSEALVKETELWRVLMSCKKSRKNTFAKHLRKLRLLQDLMRRIVSHPAGDIPKQPRSKVSSKMFKSVKAI